MTARDAASRWPTDSAFVGRRAELARLAVELDVVRSGRPRVVTVQGAPGVGKSALVRHFMSQASDLDLLDASGDECEARLPFGVLSQLLVQIDVLDCFQGLGSVDGSVIDPLSVGAQLLGVVGSLAARRPLAIVVDDAQWADTASTQALTFVMRRLRFDAVLAIFVSRDDGPGLPEAFHRLGSECGIHLPIGGLDADELAELAALAGGTKLSHRAAARLAEHSGGNPLYARALVDELSAGVLETPEASLPAPRSYAMMVLGRLAGCSPQSRRLVEAAAVLGPACRLDVAARLAELADPLPRLDEAVAARLLSAGTGARGRVGFTHPLTRAAVYHHLSAARRADLHSRAATLVEPNASLGHRVAAAVGHDPDLAAELDARARQEAGRGALAMAGGHLLDAAGLCPNPADHERLTLDAVEFLLAAGDVAAAARASSAIDQFDDHARRRYLQGHLALFMGRQAEAEELLTSAWACCDPTTDDGLRSLVSTDMAQMCGAQMRSTEAAMWARRATDNSQDAEVTAAALGVLAPCLGMVGRSAEALAALSSFTSQGPELARVDPQVLLARGTVRLWVDDLDGARADLAAVVDRCQDRPAARVALVALGALADAEYRLGAWDDSVTHATRAVSLAVGSDQLWLTAFLHSEATWALAPRGDWDRAEAHAGAALEAARSLGDAMSAFCAAAGNAHVAFFKGEHRRVVDALQPLFDSEPENVPEEPGVHPWRHVHAESLLRLGLLREACGAIEALERLAVGGGRRSSAAHAARLRALFDAECGNRERGREAFDRAVALAEDLPMPFHAAQTHDAYGRFLRRLGERRAAAGHLEAALTMYQRLGAVHLATGCANEVAACGLAPRARRDQPVDLSPQELAVARKVVAGATNREVAAELVVSVKTVEHHLSAVYAKFGVRSRTELAARMAAPPG